jgi:peptidoglycan/LPS O-acetylase OafA/YrhL
VPDRSDKSIQNNPRQSRGYLPTLDGWRAIAILSVIFCHESILKFGAFSTKWLYLYGDRGVDLFFSISGILICTRLLEEEDKNGFISLRGFYIRRFFRILPPAIFYLVTVSILGFFGIISVHIRELVAALCFFRNYTRLLGNIDIHNAVFTGHFWSLSVEEHFYLLLPGLLAFTKKRYRISILLILIALVGVNRAYQLNIDHRSWINIRWHSDVRLDALLIPAAIAIWVHAAKRKRSLDGFAKFWPMFLVLAIALIPIWEGTSLKATALALVFSLVVIGSVLHPQNILGKILESKPLRYIGRISYSLYLWQQLFMTSNFYGRRPLGMLEVWPINILMSFACAILSYYVIEKPIIRLGHRIAPPSTPGREDLAKSA